MVAIRITTDCSGESKKPGETAMACSKTGNMINCRLGVTLTGMNGKSIPAHVIKTRGVYVHRTSHTKDATGNPSSRGERVLKHKSHKKKERKQRNKKEKHL